MDNRGNCLLVVMAKAPVAGQVKTRLIPDLGRQQARDVYQALLEGTLQRAAAGSCYVKEISCAPDIHHPDFQRLSGKYQFALRRQPDGDLGQRMSKVFEQAFEHYSSVVIIGSDLIDIGATDIEQAFEHLQQQNRIVLGITKDGGYGLIGLSQATPSLFQDIPWSTSQVAGMTMQRAAEAGLEVCQLGGFQDIDTIKDYTSYRHLIFQGCDV